MLVIMLVICFPESKATKRGMIAWQLHNGGPNIWGNCQMTIASSIFLAMKPAG
jgi:hypothetical protein